MITRLAWSRQLNADRKASDAVISPVRAIHARPGAGVTAHVLQGSGLEILRVRIDRPALILVDRGLKSVCTAQGGSVRAAPGQAIALDGNQTVDFTNTITDGSHYEARWLLPDADLLEDPHYQARVRDLAAKARRGHHPAQLIARVSADLATAFERARQALQPDARVPDAVARLRVAEVLYWLLEQGVALRNPPVHPSVSLKVRALIAGGLGEAWTTEHAASHLAMSEATLRRRLAGEGASFGELLVDARMAAALTLLQATARPVSDIALAVGYESPSRFSVRFRQRFGFAPTAVRGHERPGKRPG